MTITADIKWQLPDALKEPTVVADFFTEEMFERVKNTVHSTGVGSPEHTFHTMLARWESPIQFDQDIEEYCVQRAREIFEDDSLLKAYFFVVRYQRKDGCVPHLWEHTDQNGTQTTLDITIENTADWDIVIEGQRFKQRPNDAIVFCGQQHIHSRPPYPTEREDVWTTVLFLHFTQPDHWIQSDHQGIYEYGVDGDTRFFNRNRFLALPDFPLSQPVCECHDYTNTLRLYDTFVGDAHNQPSETVDMTVLGKEELAPGIIRYSISKESARTLKGLIQNAMFKQWMPAEVLGKENNHEVNYSARNCYNYFLTEGHMSCHPQDPIHRAALSLNQGIDAIVEDFRGRYSIVPLLSHHTVLLRYEAGNKFHFHIDDHPVFPRVVSVSVFLNDDFTGGELEFKEFGLKIAPKAGDIVVFSSGFPYMHQVVPVGQGIRYSVVKWYDYIR
jgi:hypothetical protein